MSRTAICMTGMPRSLFLTPDQLAPSLEGWVSKLASTNRDLKEYTRITDWAGFPAGPHPEWLVARSIRNHVLNVLSVNGGFDLFVIEPGTRRSIGWEEALSSSIRQQRQAADRVMVILGGPEPDLPLNKSDPTVFKHWAHYRFGAEARQQVRTLGWDRALGRLQNLLYQLKHQAECNAAIRRFASVTGVTYEYKMRLRPDQAWQRDIPPLHSLQLPPNQILYASRAIGKSTEDMFGVGRAEAMDAYLDRYPFVHNFSRRPQTLWTAEEFLMTHLRSRNISLIGHEAFRCFMVRPANFSKGARVSTGGGSSDSSAPPQTRMPRAGAESAADGVVIAVNGRGDEVAMGRMADDAAAAQEAETVELAE